jgi:hypothetical protein
MKVIIAGGRHLSVTVELIEQLLLNANWSPTEIVSGACGRPEDELHVIRGADTDYIYANGIDGDGEWFALSQAIPIKRFPAEWGKHGTAAGPIRNEAMAAYADGLLIIWNGYSKGSAWMKRAMRKAGKPIIEVVLPGTDRT